MSAQTREVVLVGGGHAHVQVLRRFAMDPPRDVHLTVVLDRPEAVYSGMVPGVVAGDYAEAEATIDVVPLARRARAAVVLAPATRVDAEARRIEVAGRPALPYDVASLDVGSTVRGLGVPGVREHAVPTRPIAAFEAQLEARIERVARPGMRVGVVGGGAAGAELVLTLAHRLARFDPQVMLLMDGDAPMPRAPALGARFAREARERGIVLHTGHAVVSVGADAVVLDSGESVACDLVVWAAGAAPPALVEASPLAKDEAGFVRVDETLRAVGRRDLFAVGDCAAMDAHPWVPKAGVHAVRQGPTLIHNLRALLAGDRLRAHRPQRDFLVLLNAGGHRALGAKWGVVASGRPVHRLKDAIDRRFMRRFQTLTADGDDAPGVPTPESMGMEPMACGGCASKLGAATLERALARLPEAAADSSVWVGLDVPDDAAALRTPGGDVVLATVDGFRAFADDPFLVGRVAAINALSDVHAKGGRARHALAWVGLPEGDAGRAEETLFQVLSGVRAALDDDGVSLVGGHTTQGDGLQVGLCVLGSLPAAAEPLPLGGAQPGDVLVMTRPIGSGVLLAADMQGRAHGAHVAALHHALCRSSAAAGELVRELGAHSATDVSGFGLARHLLELLDASGVGATLDPARIPAHAGARAALRRGLRSTFHPQNESVAGPFITGEAAVEDRALLFDPQTVGGLLVAFPSSRFAHASEALRSGGERDVCPVGRVEAGAPQVRLVAGAAPEDPAGRR